MMLNEIEALTLNGNQRDNKSNQSANQGIS